MSILKNCTLIVPTFQQSKPDCDVWILFISTKFPQTYLPASIYYNVDHVLTQFMKHEHKHYPRWWYTFLHDIMVYIIYYSLVVIEAQLVHVIWPSASCYVELQPYWQHKHSGAAETSCVHLRKNQTDNFGSSRSFKIDHKFYEKITAQMHKYYRSCAMKHKFPVCPFNGCDLLVMKREREKNPFLLSCCVIYTSLLQRLNIKHTFEDWFGKSFGIKSY